MRTSKQEAVVRHPWQEYQAIFDNAAIGIAFTQSRRIVRCNHRWAEMFGYDEQELAGQPAAILYPSQDAYETLGRSARPILGEGRYFQTDLEFKRRDGSLFWCRLYGRAVNPGNPAGGTVWIAEDVSIEREAQRREGEARVELEAMFETAVLGVVVLRDRIIQRCNRRLEELFGFAPGEMLGLSTRVWYLSDDDFNGLGTAAYGELAKGGMHRREQIFQRKDGSPFWGRLSGRAFDATDVHAGSVWLLEDVTERKAREERLRNALDEQQMIFQNAAVGIMFVRNRTVQRCNRRLEELFGYGPGELGGRSTALFYTAPDVYEAHGNEAYAILERGEIYAGELEVRRRDGSRFWIRGTAHRTRDDASDATGIGVIWIIDDITERRRMQEALLEAQSDLEQRVEQRTCELANTNARLQAEVFERMQAEQKVWHIAHHDALTGLPNRNLLNDRVQQALAQAQRSGSKVALVFIDLDRFKQINDTLGHEVGDLFLKGIAERIAGAVRSVDTVSRLGGDEFVVVLQDLADANVAAQVADKILAALRPPLELRGNRLYPSASLGVALYPDHGGDLNSLLRAADNAMYHAKSGGRGVFRFFSGEMGDESARAFSIEQQLHQAIALGQFELHYQPIADVATCRPRAVEALVRWRHPERGLVSPAEFIPVAEETGLILPLGRWVLEAACAQAMAWSQAGHLPLPVAVNLSGRQFWKEDLLEDVQRVLATTGLPPQRLELEITESSLMRDADETLDKLHVLARMGVRLTVDDFGTGYSSLSYLKRFPVHRLKIDRSFVADLCDDRDDAAIVQAVVGLGRSMDLSVVAEGVETEAQLQALRGLDCPLFQGFWYARPQPAAALAPVLQASRTHAAAAAVTAARSC